MFPQTFDQPFDLVITSTECSPIVYLQSNSPNEIRVSISSRVTVSIEKPLDNVSGSLDYVFPIDYGTGKVNCYLLESSGIESNSEHETSSSSINKGLKSPCSVTNGVSVCPTQSTQQVNHSQDNKHIFMPPGSEISPGSRSTKSSLETRSVANSCCTKLTLEKSCGSKDENLEGNDLLCFVNCENHQSATALNLSSSKLTTNLKENEASTDAMDESNGDSESDIELDSDSDSTSSDPFTSDDETVHKKRRENVTRKIISSSHNPLNSVDHNDDYLLKIQTKVHIVRISYSVTNSNESASNLDQFYTKLSENFFKNNLNYFHRYIPSLKQNDEYELDSCPVIVEESDNEPFPFNRPSLSKAKKDPFPIPLPPSNGSRPLLDLDSEEEQDLRDIRNSNDSNYPDAPCPDRSVRKSVDKNPLESINQHSSFSKDANCKAGDKNSGRGDKSERPTKRKVKKGKDGKRKRIIVQSSSDSEDLDDEETDLPEVQLEEFDEVPDNFQKEGDDSERSEKLKYDQEIASQPTDKMINRNNRKRQRLNFDPQFSQSKNKRTHLNEKFGKIAKSKTNKRNKVYRKTIKKEPFFQSTGDISIGSVKSNSLTERETDDQTETMPLDSRSVIEDELLRELNKKPSIKTEVTFTDVPSKIGSVSSEPKEFDSNKDKASTLQRKESIVSNAASKPSKNCNVLDSLGIKNVPTLAELARETIKVILPGRRAMANEVSGSTKTKLNDDSINLENEKVPTLAPTVNSEKDEHKTSIEDAQIERSPSETVADCTNISPENRSTVSELKNTEPLSDIHNRNDPVEACPLNGREISKQTKTIDSVTESLSPTLLEDKLNHKVTIDNIAPNTEVACSHIIQDASTSHSTELIESNKEDAIMNPIANDSGLLEMNKVGLEGESIRTEDLTSKRNKGTTKLTSNSISPGITKVSILVESEAKLIKNPIEELKDHIEDEPIVVPSSTVPDVESTEVSRLAPRDINTKIEDESLDVEEACTNITSKIESGSSVPKESDINNKASTPLKKEIIVSKSKIVESITVNDHSEIPEIGKVLIMAELEEESIKAINDERERMERLIEQEKKFNHLRSMMDKNQEKLILDFEDNGKVRVEVDSVLLEALKDHQREGIKFMYNSTIENVDRLKEGDKGSGCILAHCMGLGKTFQAIAFVHTILSSPSTKEYIKTVLIAVPVNVLKNWKQEFSKWIKLRRLKTFKVYEINNKTSIKFRSDQLRLWNDRGGVLIIAHTLLSSLCHTRKNSQTDIEHSIEHLVDPGPDVLIIDEGHILKSSTNQLNKIVASMKTRRKILLTGTPLQNNLNEYYTMIDIIKPRLLGTSKGFANFFQTPIEKGQKADSTAEDFRVMKERESVLHQLVSGSIQRYNFDTLRPFLHPKVECALFICPTELITKMYNHFLDHVSKEKRILVHSVYLRFCINHPAIYHLRSLKGKQKEKIFGDSDPLESKLDDTPFDKDWYKKFIKMFLLFDQLNENNMDFIYASGKFVMLFKILEKCISNEEKLVVASQSIETLDLIAMLLEPSHEDCGNEMNPLKWVFGKNYFRIDGSKNAFQRHEQIEKFNDPKNKEARLFLLSTKAGGIGINLHGANRVIIFDVSWNPSDDIQAICRVYRMGQTKPVYVYRFVTKDTMEEVIFRKQIVKLGMAIRVVDQQQVERIFTASELNEFYDTRPKDAYKISDINEPQADRLLHELLSSENEDVLQCTELDSLLEKKPEEDLSEIERQLAWKEYQIEREEAKELKRKGKRTYKKSSSGEDSDSDSDAESDDNFDDQQSKEKNSYCDLREGADATHGGHLPHSSSKCNSSVNSENDFDTISTTGKMFLQDSEVYEESDISHGISSKRKNSSEILKNKNIKKRKEFNKTSKSKKNNRREAAETDANNKMKVTPTIQRQNQSKILVKEELNQPSVQSTNLSTNCNLILDVDSYQNIRVDVPKILVQKLRPHQVEGIKFMFNAIIGNVDKLKEGDKGSGCILAHSMGLGKSWQVITFIQTILSCSYTGDHIKTVLIVVPFDLTNIWEQEFDECLKLLKTFNVLACNESINMEDRLDQWQKNGGVLIIGHDTLTSLLNCNNDSEQKVATQDKTLIERHLVDPGPDLVIIDEAHKLVYKPQNSSNIRRMRTQRKILLTGIPLQNHLDEYYKMIDIIKPQFFGSAADFANKFLNPIEIGQKRNATFVSLRLPKEREDELSQFLFGSIQKFGFETLKPLLLVKFEYALIVHPTELIRNMYNHFLRRVLEPNAHLEHACYLRLLVNHPAIYYILSSKIIAQRKATSIPGKIIKTSLKEDWFKHFVQPEDENNCELSRKFLVMLKIIDGCKLLKQKLVIASQSIETLDCIQKLLLDLKWTLGKNLFRIDQSLCSIKIQEQQNQFNDSASVETQLCLLSTKDGGIGINLTGANRIIIFDVSWNSNDDIHAICRLFRIGQTKNVYVYRLVTKDTMEEQIFLKQMDKRGTGIRFVDQQQVEGIFTTSELDNFYKKLNFSEQCSLLNDPKDRLLAKTIRNSNIVFKWIEIDSIVEKNPAVESVEDETTLALLKYQKER